MADGPALALQKALVATLKANAAVAALVGARVYDEPPQGVTFPYVRIGTVDPQPTRDSCNKEWSIIFSIEGHSHPVAGRVGATRMAEAVVDALDEQEPALTVSGFKLEWLYWLTQAVTRDTDGESYTAVIAFEASLAAA